MQNTKEIRPLWAEIDLDAIAHNMREIRRCTDKNAMITAVIKADGYGHGAVGIAQTLIQNGADRFAVAVLDEAIELRQAGFQQHILVLGYTGPERVEEVVKYEIEPTVYHLEVAEALSKAAEKAGKKVLIHIKIDSGMGRIGFRPTEESVAVIKEMSELPHLELEGIFTHFAVADEADKTFTWNQFQKFKWVCDALDKEGVKVNVHHCANSATILDIPEMHWDMVRAGVILYGMLPSEEVRKDRIDLKTALTLKCRVTNVKTIAPGDSVSYGRKFIAEKPTTIASLPAGYADGYTRMLSGKAEALIHGKRVPVVGRICMDQCMIDVTEIDDVQVGDEVVLFGAQEGAILPVEELADKLGTINYEVVCMLARRVPRVYVKNGEVVNIVNYLYQ